MKHNRNVLAQVLGLYLDAALRTSRWEIDADPQSWKLLTGQTGEAAIVIFWHEYLPVVPILWWRARRQNPALSLNALVSRHRDGRMIAQVMRRWQIDSVAGSSARVGKPDKGGASGLRGLLRLLRAGRIVSLTPDGPRGPRRVMQPGAAQLAAISGVRVVPIAARLAPTPRARSWDRMVLPLPFSRVTILCGPPIAIPRDAAEAGLQHLTLALQALDQKANNS
ncbi:lysophospholipid acyltransferase family protein [Lichenicoccus sp.]|uniref:lysophospholipid acyltransferase family protein n=1 Tax=Lichenicoccus sp. TaxID=2781899 RepID=UPI003D0B3F63